MKIAIYSPYLDTFGGGEKYFFTIAEFLSEKERVDFLLGTHLYDIDIDKVKKRLMSLHGLNLLRVNFIKAPIGENSSFLARFIFFKKYDFLFYLTDGSIFYSTAKNNIIHFQVPFENSPNNFWDSIKLSSWKMAIYNSNFTKDIVEKNWPLKGTVIYPPVSVKIFKPKKKKKQIISVGRFAGHTRSKKYLVLIDIFGKLKVKDWSLHLVGGANEGDKKYINELKKEAQGLNIFFYENLELGNLVKLYGESSIYWHAAGFEEKDPKKMEHFGITTVEAMAAGCVPIVINLGGQREIVEHGKSGFLWNTKEQIMNYTLRVIEDSNLLRKLSQSAAQRSKMFSKDKFCQQINKIVYG